MTLRDALLAGLNSLPGTREFHLHVLVSSPRKHGNLFPFANPRPRSYLQDILILLSEQTTPDSSPVFVSAIEACVYNIPTTSCAILYVSKVDSTGQATAPSPTPALVRALLLFYADPATRPISANHLWIHVFARAQNQYLFPNSSEYPNKRPLSDIKLCAWWKRQFSTVVGELATRVGDTCRTKLYYILPGLSEFEAHHSLERVYPSTGSCSWTYGHPYSQDEIPLPCPCPSGGDSPRHLGQCIPSFDDDPKSRFIDEIAYTTDADGVRSPERKRARADTLKTHEEDTSSADASEKKEGRSKKEDQTHKEVKKVSVEEFWERMSFRQECIAGAVTGFFVIAVSDTSRPASTLTASEVSPLAPQAGQVSSQMNKRVLTSLLTAHEFPSVEKAVWSTKVIEDTIRGLCDGLKSNPVPLVIADRSGRQTPEPEPIRSTLAPPQTPPPRLVNGKRPIVDISPNPFPEPVASLETYHSYIYGTIAVKNRPPPTKEHGEATSAGNGRPAIITVLTARKKRTKS